MHTHIHPHTRPYVCTRANARTPWLDRASGCVGVWVCGWVRARARVSERVGGGWVGGDGEAGL
jgi:hypothetical protein